MVIYNFKEQNLLGKINMILERFFEIRIVKAWRFSTLIAREKFGKKPIDVIEIGVEAGENSRNILRELNVNKIYLVDPWEEYDDYSESECERTQDKIEETLVRCKKNLRKYKDKTVYARGYSSDVYACLPRVDFIYIDGNHEYDYVLEDLENYYPLLKEGGIIAGHDICWQRGNAVIDAVRDFCEKNNLIFHVCWEDWWIDKAENELSEIKSNTNKDGEK